MSDILDDRFRPWLGTPNKGEYTMIVRDVHDGDSFTACLLVPIKCRVMGINSPELKHEGGSAARQATRDLILGKQLTAKLLGTEKYGRVLADLVIDGRWLSDLLIESGQAVRYFGHGIDP